ncbi:MAG: winged helix-turn-helix transcriptional regulator [Rhodoferax sp.]|nr:winged helix-turn-helix transcriptional regulator [Rhodoferax sp.]
MNDGSPRAVSELSAVEGRRTVHLGRWLALASQRFDSRVLARMAGNEQLPLALGNLAARGRLTASHIHITRHLTPAGLRLGELAAMAGVSKQAMGKLVDQCAAWNLVERRPDLRDARARQVMFTPTGLVWLAAYEEAVHQTEAELQAELGKDVATVLTIGLEAYAA